MSILFISDLHLEDSRPELTRAFLDFLERKHRTVQQLYILGDLFEVWVGDDVDSTTSRQVKEALRHFQDDFESFFIAGNRDFLVGRQFAEETGVNLLEDGHQLKLDGLNTILMHGDALCTDDTEYQAFKQMVRNPAWQQDFLAKSPTERLAIAASIRQKSQQSNSEKQLEIMDANPDAVIELFATTGADLLIHGHTHRPARHPVKLNDNQKPKERIVLGDWGQRGWALEYHDGHLELSSFAIEPDH